MVEPDDKELAAQVRKGEACFIGDGIAINSGKFTGLSTAEFKEQITKWLEEKGLGKKAVNYKLRDWLFSAGSDTGASRSRYCIAKTAA